MKINISSIKVAVGVAIFSMALMLFQFLYVGIVLKKETEKNSNEIALQTAQKIANSVEVYFRDALTVTHTYSHNFLVYKQAQLPRTTVYDIMHGSLSLNKNFLAIWTMWEPNAFDNKDHLYKNDTIHDLKGSFAIAYYYDENRIKQEINDTADYYEDYYTIPKNYQESIILDPFYYQYHGNSKIYFETSMVSPIIENENFLGVIGIDIDMYELQETYSKTRIFNEGFISLLSNSGVIVTHKSPEFIEKKIQDYASDDSLLITNFLKSGKAFNTESYSNFSNEVAVRHFYPINMSNMAAPWYVMIEIPKSTILKESNRLKTISTIILIASLILLWYLSYNIFDRNRKEKKLKETISIVELSEYKTKQSEERAKLQRSAMSSLAIDKSISDDDLDLALNNITKIVTETIHVERCSIWLLNADFTELKCISLYELGTKKHSSGTVLNSGNYPSYFKAIKKESRIYANDAQNDPRTSEFANNYLIPLGITSMLDAGITLENKLIGVLCLEHVGRLRKWEADEEAFATSIASMIAQIMANHNRRETEKKLSLSQIRYKKLIEAFPDLILVTDLNHKILYANSAMEKYANLPLNELINADEINAVHPDDKSYVDSEIANLLNLELENTGVFDYRILKSGMVAWFSSVVCRIDFDGAPALLYFLKDITQRKKVEQELKESEERFKTLSSIASEGLMIHENGIIVDLNLTFAKILGYSSIEELIGKDALNVIPFTDDSKKLVYEHFKNESDATFDVEIIQFNGTKVPIETRGIEISYKGRKANLVYIRDIIERKKAEKELENYRNHLELLVKERTHELDASNEELQASNEELNSQRNALEETLQNLKNTQNQLIQAEKMASLGVLTAGVAHEINNPLNYIYNGTAAIENYIKEKYSDETHILNTLFEAVTTGVERISGIVKSMSRYSRKEDLPYANCDIHEVIDDCLIILHNKYKNRIEINKNYLTDPAITFANEGQLHQVMLNIIANSIQAIENKGIITINMSIDKKFYSISITDNGKGIPKEVMDKIFDPFFTTKNPGEGTGLGLSITKKIIEEHNGTISCESVLNSHTKFIIRLPIKS